MSKKRNLLLAPGTQIGWCQMNRPDVCDLIAVTYTKDNEGYETVTESTTTHFCNWSDGVGQYEFYLAHKEGFQASASVEIFADEYNKEKLVEFHGVRYNVIRMFQRNPDTAVLILEEVTR